MYANYRLKYCLDYHGVGRVGEPKFLKYKNMSWVGSLSIIRWYWPEVKTLQNYLQTFCRDYDSYLTCVFHAFGCVWILDGLVRVDDVSAPLKDFVFYKDIKRTMQSFTELSSRILKQHVPAKVKDNVTGKSIRQAGITVMDAHPQMTSGLSNNRCGHCTGDNRKHYNFGTIAGSMPGMKVLAGVGSIDAPVSACRMRALITAGFLVQDDVDIFIDNLIQNDLPIFKKNGRNRVVMDVCVATVIHSYRSMVKEFAFEVTNNLCVGGTVVNRLRTAVWECKLAPGRGAEADSLLFKWADEIDRDLQESNLNNQLRELQQSSNNQATSLLIQLIEKMRQENKTRETSSFRQNEELKGEIQGLQEKVSELETTLNQQAVQDDTADTRKPEARRAPGNKSDTQSSKKQRTSPSSTLPDAVPNVSPVAMTPTNTQQAPTGVPRNVFEQMRRNAVSEVQIGIERRANEKKEKKLTIALLLMQTHESIVRLKMENAEALVSSVGFPAAMVTTPKSAHRVGWAMKCVDAIWRDGDQEVFTNANANESLIRRAITSIHNRLKQRVKILHQRYLVVKYRNTELTVGALAQRVEQFAKVKKYGVEHIGGRGKTVTDAEKQLIVEEFDPLNDPADL